MEIHVYMHNSDKTHMLKKNMYRHTWNFAKRKVNISFLFVNSRILIRDYFVVLTQNVDVYSMGPLLSGVFCVAFKRRFLRPCVKRCFFMLRFSHNSHC